MRKARGHRWSDSTIKSCIHAHLRSPGMYEFFRRTKFLLLPCRRTLQGYIGGREGELGISRLVRERLGLESKRLNRHQKHISIMVDEVTLKPMEIYLRNTDQFIGRVNTGPNVKSKTDGMLANKMLTFDINGLCTPFTIPVGYYLGTRSIINQIWL